jgi:probable phosphoglycerate mutase
MRLLLIRHGDAHAGFHGVIGGETGCTGLTELGRAQASALCDHLARTSRVHADVLVASTLRRAIETADLIAPGLGLEVSAHERDLCEVHTGEADGLTWTEYTTRYGSFDMVAEPDRTFAPEGDSWNSFHERVDRVLHLLADEHAERTVVAVCHAGVIMASLRVLLPITVPSADLRPSNTGVTEWEHDTERGRWVLHGFNDTAHLLDLGGATPPP